MVLLATAPTIVKAIVSRLRQWRKYGDQLPPITSSDLWGSRQAVLEQDKIGWYSFLLGRISRRWSDSQQRYLTSLHKKNTGRRWASSLIQKALDVAWDMWEQRNEICHNTLHPRRAAEVLVIQDQLRSLFRLGPSSLLPLDRLLFSKSEATLLQGSPSEMQQWIQSVQHAALRSTAFKDAQHQSMHSERACFQRWMSSA
jgi:hypothetical protein